MKTKIFNTILILFLFATQLVKAQEMIIDKVIATVGGELTLLSELEEQYALMKDQNSDLPPDFRCNIMARILGDKLLLNQSKLDSILVTNDEVEQQLNARIDRILAYMNNDVSQFEDYYGQTVNAVKEQMREDLKNQLLIDRMRNEVVQSITVTPSEVKAFFEDIPTDSLPYFNSEVEIGEIVHYPQVNETQKNKSIALLDSLRAVIINDEATFEEMARKFSDDGSAQLGGDLGWAKRGKYVAAFEAAAFKLEPDSISPVVESEFGFHLIQLLERRGNSIHVRHILVKPEITDEDISLAYNHLDSVRQLIVADSITFSLAVKNYSNDKVQSYNNDGRMVNPVSGNTFFEIGDLDPDIYFTIDTLDIGDVSKPFEFRDARGEKAFRIVELQSRTSPHIANLQQDYAKILAAAKEAKRNEFIAQWIDEKINSTFIQIDDMFNSCPSLDPWRKKEAAVLGTHNTSGKK